MKTHRVALRNLPSDAAAEPTAVPAAAARTHHSNSAPSVVPTLPDRRGTSAVLGMVAPKPRHAAQLMAHLSGHEGLNPYQAGMCTLLQTAEMAALAAEYLRRDATRTAMQTWRSWVDGHAADATRQAWNRAMKEAETLLFGDHFTGNFARGWEYTAVELLQRARIIKGPCWMWYDDRRLVVRPGDTLVKLTGAVELSRTHTGPISVNSAWVDPATTAGGDVGVSAQAAHRDQPACITVSAARQEDGSSTRDGVAEARRLRLLADMAGTPHEALVDGRWVRIKPLASIDQAIAAWHDDEYPFCESLESSYREYRTSSEGRSQEYILEQRRADCKEPKPLAGLTRDNHEFLVKQRMQSAYKSSEIGIVAAAYVLAAPSVIARSDKIVSDDDAIEAALENLRTWAGGPHCAHRTHAAFWFAAIADCELRCLGRYCPSTPGEDVQEFAERLSSLARVHGQRWWGHHNGMRLRADPGDAASAIMAPFKTRQAEVRADFAAERARKLRGVTVVDSPPPGFVVDLGGKFSGAFGLYYQVTAAQLRDLPIGTRLFSIIGQECIVGVDVDPHEDFAYRYPGFGFRPQQVAHLL